MPTNNYIESCFWNFDALFQPQQHPARDAHDTFFVSGLFVLMLKDFKINIQSRKKNISYNNKRSTSLVVV